MSSKPIPKGCAHIPAKPPITASNTSLLRRSATALGPAQFEGERWLDPKIVALMEKIVMARDAALEHTRDRLLPLRHPAA